MKTPSVTPGTPRSSSPTGRERRRSQREDRQVLAFVATADGGTRVAVSDLNLSRHGVGFTSFQPFAEGSFCLIEIGFGDQRLISEIQVVSCKPSREGQHKVGAEFC
jgi:hypothetical protein